MKKLLLFVFILSSVAVSVQADDCYGAGCDPVGVVEEACIPIVDPNCPE